MVGQVRAWRDLGDGGGPHFVVLVLDRNDAKVRVLFLHVVECRTFVVDRVGQTHDFHRHVFDLDTRELHG